MWYNDEVDEGVVSVPKSVRDLAFNAAKDTHSWMTSDQRSALQLQERSDYLNSLIAKVGRKVETV